jgi:hypothetical protein
MKKAFSEFGIFSDDLVMKKYLTLDHAQTTMQLNGRLPPLPLSLRSLYNRAGTILDAIRARIPRLILYVPAANGNLNEGIEEGAAAAASRQQEEGVDVDPLRSRRRT